MAFFPKIFLVSVVNRYLSFRFPGSRGWLVAVEHAKFLTSGVKPVWYVPETGVRQNGICGSLDIRGAGEKGEIGSLPWVTATIYHPLELTSNPTLY